MDYVSYYDGVKEQVNTPNKVTAFRVFLTLPLGASSVFVAEVSWIQVLAVMVIALAGYTDWLDGYLARKLGAETPLGRVGDPLADKLFIDLGLLLALPIWGGYWLLVTTCIVIVAYDADNTWRRRREIARAFLGHREQTADLPVTPISKSKTFFLFIFLIACYLPQWVPIEHVLALALISLCLVLTSWWNNRKASIMMWLGNLRW